MPECKENLILPINAQSTTGRNPSNGLRGKRSWTMCACCQKSQSQVWTLLKFMCKGRSMQTLRLMLTTWWGIGEEQLELKKEKVCGLNRKDWPRPKKLQCSRKKQIYLDPANITLRWILKWKGYSNAQVTRCRCMTTLNFTQLRHQATNTIPTG